MARQPIELREPVEQNRPRNPRAYTVPVEGYVVEVDGKLKAVPGGRASGRMNSKQELLFDTGCLLDIYHGRSRIKSYFDAVLPGAITPYLSVITEAELWRGFRANEVARPEALINHFMILPLGSEAARLAGSWMQKYDATGLGWMDALITATAKMANVSLLTRDKRLAQVLANEANFEIYE